MKGQCEVEGCKNPAKWAMYKTFPNGEQKWIHVCDSHEQEIGAENFKRAGGYLTAKELQDLQAMKDADKVKG